MPFRVENFPVYALLIELHLHCGDAEHAMETFKKACRNCLQRDHGRSAPEGPSTPGDVLAWGFISLACLNHIRLMLQPTRKSSEAKKKRCGFLNRLLGHPRLDNVLAAATRHSWEHFDDRLDDIIGRPRPKSYQHFHVSDGPPDSGTLVFRSIDTKRITIRVLDDEIAIEPCLTEVKALDGAVIAAHDSMADGRIIAFP